MSCAVFSSIALIGVLYVSFSYPTVIGFNNDANALTFASVPMVDAAQGVANFLAFLAYIAGFTSIVSSLISATNSEARTIFNSGREGLLPSVTGRVTARSQTPWVAFVVFLGLALGLTYVGLALGLTYVFCRSSNPDGVVVFFGEIATLGTILVAFIYLVANLALPFYWRRFHAEAFSPVTHLILPLLGVAAIGYPLYELVKPGQPAPFNIYPWIALGVLVAALLRGAYVYRRDPALGERVGSIVADAD